MMLSTAMGAGVTSAIRDFGSEVESQGRLLGMSVRHLLFTAGTGESSREDTCKGSPASDFVIVDKTLTQC